MGNGKNKIAVEQGRIVKVGKDKNGVVTREVLTQHWTDWVDYWSVDFEFESSNGRASENGMRLPINPIEFDGIMAMGER